MLDLQVVSSSRKAFFMSIYNCGKLVDNSYAKHIRMYNLHVFLCSYVGILKYQVKNELRMYTVHLFFSVTSSIIGTTSMISNPDDVMETYSVVVTCEIIPTSTAEFCEVIARCDLRCDVTSLTSS